MKSASGVRLADIPDPFDLDFTTPSPAPSATPFAIVAMRARRPGAAGGAVLVVDGDELAGERTAATLRAAGYHAAVETTPRAAARHMSRLGSPGLVLLEVDLPQMSGFDFLERLRANQRLKDTPVVFLTSRGGREDLVRALQAGADGYITKPLGPAALLSAIDKALPR